MTKIVEINENLLEEALALGKDSEINLLLENALKDYINKYKQQKIIDLFGTIDYEENFDYKQQRKRQ
ncbi:type II toxin-antitoxin system VapB family antitoxin [Geminocystis herdmanii]|uniref:type II toxin-antitoxin system VapB family antitoxin n=1 Tax=Geminocystis herdmanii TaxID=669359 RepID=UPI000374F2BD|nr:type II toxin-antitoxin system VapB family antitoxin [Geminocystis herdmanii]